ncbi:MAG: TetR/AcrR family transcriptional regulator, partial [Desulfobacca sp.]|nr:TetR/AcrR family transcriptional regulator [Desulfobacca sp.]
MTVQPKFEIRKGQILNAAERIFAQKGYHDATISDVAREAKVSEATIYEYFPSKEELLFSIPRETVRHSKDRIEFMLQFIQGASNRLRAVIYHYLWFYETNPDYAAVTMMILKQNRKFLEEPAYQDIREVSRVILQIVAEGVAAGEFKADINPHLVRSAILGTIEHMLTRRILLGKPDDLIGFTDSLTDLIVNGISTRKSEKVWNLQIRLEPEG